MKLTRPIRCAIFDLDGVLLDTEPLYTEATQQVVGPYGKIFDWSVKGEMIGRSAIEGARYIVQALALPITPEEYLKRRRPLLEALFRSAREMPGASAFVRALKEHGLRLGVATSSERALYALKTAHHPWFADFDVIVCGDDPRIARLKPAPDIFLLAARELAIAPAHCLVVEDSLAGVEAARAAGMQVIALPDPHMAAARYSQADWVVRSYADIAVADLGL